MKVVEKNPSNYAEKNPLLLVLPHPFTTSNITVTDPVYVTVTNPIESFTGSFTNTGCSKTGFSKSGSSSR